MTGTYYSGSDLSAAFKEATGFSVFHDVPLNCFQSTRIAPSSWAAA